MDMTTRLALMTAAKRVFEQDGTFLSFPAIAPPTYRPDELTFDGPLGIPNLARFSQEVNHIPDGPLYRPVEATYLWDIYRRMFETAELAVRTATPEQMAAYERARAVLYTLTPEGRQNTPAMLAYMQHRDLWFKALEDYKAGQVTAVTSTDPEVKARWQANEPALRERIDQADAAWVTNGFRAEVEAAERAMRANARLCPELIWGEWEDAYLPILDDLTEARFNQPFAATGFSPSDPFDEEWTTVTLSADEIAALAAEAPAELKRVLDLTGGDPPPERVSFEFRSVVLNRSWFHKEAFSSRFWRLPPTEEPLSDGGNPPRGRCPAYITALVFARNITEWRRPAAGGGPSRVPIKTLPALRLRAEFVRPPVSPPPPPVAGPGIALRPGRFAAAVARPAAMHPAAAVSPMMIARTRAAPGVAARAVSPLERLRGSTFKRIAFPLAERPRVGVGGATLTPTPPPPPPDPTPSAPSRDITILAFICKPLPKCPDPDPTLKWV